MGWPCAWLWAKLSAGLCPSNLTFVLLFNCSAQTSRRFSSSGYPFSTTSTSTVASRLRASILFLRLSCAPTKSCPFDPQGMRSGSSSRPRRSSYGTSLPGCPGSSTAVCLTFSTQLIQNSLVVTFPANNLSFIPCAFATQEQCRQFGPQSFSVHGKIFGSCHLKGSAE